VNASPIRTLIVNADDLGLCEAVNAGIFQAFDQGIVTSTSLMVRRAAAPAAAEAARARPRLSVGLHLDLGEWAYDGGRWSAVYEVVDTSDRAAVASEVDDQLERYRALMEADPTHIDSHQHVHREQPVAEVVREVAAALGVPVRGATPGIACCGAFYGQANDGTRLDVGPERLVELVRSLPAGTTELSCHPSRGLPADRLYREPRVDELAALCDARVAARIRAERIRLCSFADVRA
jgi:chitin disaccharide deacetylase